SIPISSAPEPPRSSTGTRQSAPLPPPVQRDVALTPGAAADHLESRPTALGGGGLRRPSGRQGHIMVGRVARRLKSLPDQAAVYALYGAGRDVSGATPA